MTATKVVFDEQGARYELRERIGWGGQGEVWRTVDGRRVVKRLFARRSPEVLRRQIAWVKRLDLSGLHVARPVALLRAPTVGYVAEFLQEMVPLAALLRPTRGASPLRWYGETGGLRRRLRLLAHAGETLAALHGRGLAYGDLSPANVFVSSSPEHAESWLIDLDNLRHESDPANAVFTPGYGAPEVIRGRRGSTSLSDAWSFAVVGMEALRLVHPFVGDRVADGEPELEEAAFAAEVPWVEHATDASNRATAGISRERVINERLLDLARRAFEAPGHDPTTRPSVGEWVDRLHAAADQTLRCGGCRATFFANAVQCPWCGRARDRFVLAVVRRWEPEHRAVAPKEMPPVGRLVVSRDESTSVVLRIAEGRSGVAGREALGVLAWRERGVFVQPQVGATWFAADARPGATASAREIPAQGMTVPTDGEGWRIHFGPLDRPHRVAIVKEGLHANR